MSKIKIFSLGGLNELGKNTYVVEVDEDIFILDAGLKYAMDTMYGIDYIIPDYKYLVKNKNRIKGLFISHSHPENMGGTKDLLKNIPELKIYATKYSANILKMEGINEKNIVEILPHKKIDFKDISVFPISVSHSTPDSVMYVINTKDGAVVYTGDFIIDPSMKEPYGVDLGKIAYVGKLGVLCLLSESVFSERKGFSSPNHRLVNFFQDTINRHNNRIMITLLPSHLYTIQEIFNALVNSHRKVVIMGNKLQRIVKMAIEDGYLKVRPDLIGDLSNVKDPDAILLVCDDKEKPYQSISKIISGNDKFIEFKETDTVIFASPTYDSNEKTLVNLMDDIAMKGAHSINLPKDKEILHHASSEDLMLMLRLISPKYYMPVKGEYRYQVENGDLAYSLGIPKENILLKQNGDVVTIENGKLIDDFEHIDVDDVLIDGLNNGDVGDLVVKDRELLSENGIVLISATLSKKGKKVLYGPEVITRGFIYVKDSQEMIEDIKKISLEIIQSNVINNYIDYNKVKQEIRENLSKFLYDETESNPMIIAVIQEI
ncbi:MAG: ribonuclease J [Mollicutes bacterium]|nr:ribonuclease J [Mollicutes bacterium]